MFTAALVKTPCKNMINGISSANLGKPDYSLALQQHENYITALKSCGLTVKVLDPDENFPDSTFIEDTCLITPKCSIIMNPGADTRKDETISIRAVIEDLGRPVEEITFPGTVDAGDIMMARERSLAWSSIMVEKGALDHDDALPVFITTSTAVIEYLETICDDVTNALDLDQIKVHENGCENIKEWHHQFTQDLMDTVKAGSNLKKQSFEVTDKCRLEGQIKLYLFSGSGINELFNRTEKQIPVCWIRLK